MTREPRRVGVLALSYLFPNRAHPGYGVFVSHRLQAVGERCDVTVIAPVQWYPLMRYLRGREWSGSVPKRERIQGLDTFHPRFAVVPRYVKWIDAITYLWAVRRVVKRLTRDVRFNFDIVDVHWTYPDISTLR